MIQLVNGGIAFLVTGVALLVVLRLRWMRTLPESRQRTVIWLTVASSGFAVCWLPLVLVLLRR